MTAPAVVILGNDAVLAARPATPVQLAHACLAAGYRAVVPASWGDELVAAATTQIIAGRGERPAIHCACPHVARRVLTVGSELAPYLVSIVAPPVAAARYVRRHSAGSIRITYVGRCPAAADDSIDARLTPEELLAQMADRGIDLLSQPTIFESVIPPDRRRHLSLPGGLPTDVALRGRGEMALETLDGDDLATLIAEKVVSGTNSLLDLAPAVGCACSGASAAGSAADVRAAVIELEPPRAPSGVVDTHGAIALELPVTIAARSALDVIASPHGPAPQQAPPVEIATPVETPAEPAPQRRPRITPVGVDQVILPTASGAPAAPTGAPRRRSVGAQRVIPGALPVASDQEGRVLPRMYVARRRSPRAGVPAFAEPPFEQPLEVARPITPAVEPPPPPPPPPPVASVSPEEVEARAPERVQAPEIEAPAPRSSDGAAPVPSLPAAATPAPGGRGRSPTPGSWPVLRANPRLTLAALLGAAGLLLGVAIGWAAARRGSETPATAAPNGAESGGRVDAESAGRVTPTTPVIPQRSVQPGPRTAPRAASRRPTARPDRTRTSTDAARPAAAAAPATPAPAPLDSVAAPRIDPAAAGADAARRETARAESLAAEREAIRRELEARRARIDSLTRRVGELSTPPSRAPSPTPPR